MHSIAKETCPPTIRSSVPFLSVSATEGLKFQCQSSRSHLFLKAASRMTIGKLG
jgi:hypothetical protein